MKKLLIALLVAVALSSCQQQAVHINDAEAVAVEYKFGRGGSWQLRWMPYGEAQSFVDSVGAVHYDIVYKGRIVSSK